MSVSCGAVKTELQGLPCLIWNKDQIYFTVYIWMTGRAEKEKAIEEADEKEMERTRRRKGRVR
jgi:hypothetical protein